MIPENEGVTTRRWTRPDVGRLISSCSCSSKIGNEYLSEHLRPTGSRLEVLDRIEVCNVDTFLLFTINFSLKDVVTVVLLHIHAKDANIEAINLLKECDSLGLVVDPDRRHNTTIFAWLTEMLSNHLWYFEALRTVRNHTYRHGLLCVRNIAGRDTITNPLLDKRRNWSLGKGFCGENRYGNPHVR